MTAPGVPGGPAMMDCPAGRASELEWLDSCPTQLQPYRGRMVEGVTQHLVVVHGITAVGAARLAAAWIRGGGRATR